MSVRAKCLACLAAVVLSCSLAQTYAETASITTTKRGYAVSSSGTGFQTADMYVGYKDNPVIVNSSYRGFAWFDIPYAVRDGLISSAKVTAQVKDISAWNSLLLGVRLYDVGSLSWAVFAAPGGGYYSNLVGVYLHSDQSKASSLQFSVAPGRLAGRSEIGFSFKARPEIPSGSWGDQTNRIVLNNPVLVIQYTPHRVSTPSTPSGPSVGLPAETLTFSTSGSTCNKGHSVQYQFNWGDGTAVSSWGTAARQKAYTSVGTYGVSARARCSAGVNSAWSGVMYVTIVPRVTVWVRSQNPSSGVTVTVGPYDLDGRGSGTTPFSRAYRSGDHVVLTAALTAPGGNPFQRWLKNGVIFTTSRTTMVTTGDDTYTAVYGAGSPVISCSPGVLLNSCTQGYNASPQSLQISNSGAGTLSYSISDDVPWLSVSPTSGASTAGGVNTHSVTYSTSGLAAGIHEATITITASGASNSPQTVPVSLTVMPGAPVLPAISYSPGVLSGSCTAGANAASQTFAVWNSGGGTLSYTVTEYVSWLSVSPTSGTSVGEDNTHVVSYSTSGLAVGTYQATITITGSGASNSPQTIPVHLTVTPVQQQVATPTFSPPAPLTFTSSVTVSISCATSGVTIRYTTNGSDPTSSSTVYSGPLTFSATTTLKARAFKSGMTDSAVATGVYTKSGPAGDAYEPDDSASAAKTISNGQTQSRSIHVAGNVDWVQFTLSQSSGVVIDTNGPSGDDQMWLYGPNSSTVLAPTPNYSDDAHGLWARIDHPTSNPLPPGTYYIMIQEFGNNETIPAYTLSLTVTPGGGALVPLQNNTPVTGISGSQGSEKNYVIGVPTGRSNLTIRISGGTGDCDLYVKYGSMPTTSSWDYRPYTSTNEETVSVLNPQGGNWYIMLRGYAAYSGVTLVASY